MAQFDLLLNYALVLEIRPNLLNWGNRHPNTFAILKDGIKPASVNDKITKLVNARQKSMDKNMFLVGYSDRYLYGKYENNLPVVFDWFPIIK